MTLNNKYLYINTLKQKIISMGIIDIIDNNKYMIYYGYNTIKEENKENLFDNFADLFSELNNLYDIIVEIKDKELLNHFLDLNFEQEALNKDTREFLVKYNLYEYAI